MSAITTAATAVIDAVENRDAAYSQTDLEVAMARVVVERAEAGGGAVTGTGVAGTPAGGVLSVQGVSGGTVLPVSDGGGALTVDGTVTVQDGGGSLTVDGTVAVSSVPQATAPSAPFTGKTTVTTAGTQVALGASQALVLGVWIRAATANTGIIYVGDLNVDSTTGYDLAPGESQFFPIANRATLFIDASADSQSVSYYAV